ncbi:hypothetical protein SAMN05661096_03857 [Marivirga sericea]|uniref:Uncharacterized protein n=1 Tax=Marivirga sericea TaxID=1028 RepID=A0A1X7LFY3_9BACT|nr:hypothetical protein [Marivirga sericea]SMG52079.1 hypothetical protein SAMN05661096_03857 [Marivirga sericea]
MNLRKTFQILSYLQYPLMLTALFFALKPYFHGFDYMVEHYMLMLEDFNKMLIFMGLGISFSTLQDTTKTQNKFSQKIWEDPKKGKIVLYVMLFMVLLLITFGCSAYFFMPNEAFQELSIGSIVLGIGFIGFLKTGFEVFENHRLDKKVERTNDS